MQNDEEKTEEEEKNNEDIFPDGKRSCFFDRGGEEVWEGGWWIGWRLPTLWKPTSATEGLICSMIREKLEG